MTFKALAAAPGAPVPPAAPEPLTAGKSIWPESQFDFAALDGVEGKLGVTFGTLTLAPGMGIRNALARRLVCLTRLRAAPADRLVLGRVRNHPG